MRSPSVHPTPWLLPGLQVGTDGEDESGPSPSTPESLRQEIAIALEHDAASASDNDEAEPGAEDSTEDSDGDSDMDSGGDAGEERPERPRGTFSSVYDPSTIRIGPFALVKRHVAGVPAMFVNCPLHTYKDEDGMVHRCTKTMQLNQPNEDTVVDRLHWWVWRGHI